MNRQSYSGEATGPFSADLAEMFDRYSAAMDNGDNEGAEAILAMYPGIDDDFITPLRGLYLLGCEARHQEENLETAPAAPRRLGDFVLGDELGRGGMGIVYAATQISLQRKVALKILPFTAVLDPRQVTRFQNEAKSAASLHHPNIVPVYGVGCERGVHYYSMQLIEGQTMAQLIRQLTIAPADPADRDIKTVRRRPESCISTVASIQSTAFVKNVLQLAVKIAHALHFAHEQGIVHRDIKPSNILLDQSGSPWIADFGLARGRAESNLTSQGDQLGTLRYMSPEQAAGRNHQVDFRSDIYSLGVTIYELLTLVPAFGKSARMELLFSIQNDTAQPVSQLNRSVPMDLETVVLKAIAKDPFDRYQSAADLAADLERCLEGRKVLAKRKSLLERTFDVARKNKSLTAALACGLLLLVVGVSVLAAVFHGQRNRERIASQSARFHLQQAHRTVDRYGKIFSDQLAGVPGSQTLRRELLTESMGYYSDFLEYSASRPELALERGQAHMHLASLQQRSGNFESAAEQFRFGIETFEQLDGPESKVEHARCRLRTAIMNHDRGELEAAHDQLSFALGLLADREDKDTCLVRSALLTNAAMLNIDRGILDSAEKQFAAAMNILPDGDDPELLETRLRVQGCYAAFLAQTDPQKSIELSTQTVDWLKQLKSPTHRSAVCLANLQNNLAILQSRTGQTMAAKSNAQAALSFWESKQSQSPNHSVYLEKLATAANTVGEIHWKDEELTSADQSFQVAESLLGRAWASSSSQPEHASRLAGVLHNRSHVAFAIGDLDLAIERINQAIGLQQKAIELAPGNKRFTALLQNHRQTKASFDQVQVGQSKTAVPEATAGGDFVAQRAGDQP